MLKSIAAITGDVHFTTGSLELATQSVVQAVKKAEELSIPLILNGDTLDSKAIIRAECANRLIELLKAAKTHVYVNTGNHDLINEKASEHSLHFLKPYATVVDVPTWFSELNSYIVPYCSNEDTYKTWLESFRVGSRLIVHQGVMTAFLGHYVQDKTSLPPEAFKDFRVIGSHYHRAQDIKCGPIGDNQVGLFSYVGTPYTQSFAEANDGPKGFQLLKEDGTLELVPTNLRAHRVFERTYEEILNMMSRGIEGSFFGLLNADDLIWLKVKGNYVDLQQLDKDTLGKQLFGHSNYKLDKIYADAEKLETTVEDRTDAEILDNLIDNTSESLETKEALKSLWRQVIQ